MPGILKFEMAFFLGVTGASLSYVNLVRVCNQKPEQHAWCYWILLKAQILGGLNLKKERKKKHKIFYYSGV